MQEKIKTLIELMGDDAIQTYIQDVISEYADAINKEGELLNVIGDLPKTSDIFDWSLEGGNLVVRWTRTWSYGGRADGGFSFPVSHLWDRDAREANFAAKLASAQAQYNLGIAGKDEAKEAKERSDLKRLQKKYAESEKGENR